MLKAQLGLLIVAAAAFVGCGATGPPEAAAGASQDPMEDRLLLASPGRVETRDDPLNIGVAASGVLERLFVRQNDVVRAGQVLARLDCRDLRAELAQFESELEVAATARDRLVAGGRPEDRAAAAANADAARARLDERRAWYERMLELSDRQSVSKSELDRAERDHRVAEADFRVAAEQCRAAAAEPLPEDLAKAEARIQAASDRVAAARACLDKCTVVSPLSGAVLRTFVSEGEFLSSANPKPLVTVADLSRLRVRAEIDEHDIGRVKLARSVSIQSDAWPGRVFPASIDYEAPLMGRRQTRTGDPAEKSDRDVLEVLLDIEASAQELPLGLRVTAQFWR